MKLKLTNALPIALLMAAGLMAADPKPAPAFVVQAIMTDETDAYVSLLAQANAVIKAKTGLEKLRHAWVGDYAGENSHGLFVVSQFESAAAATTFSNQIAGDAEMGAILAKFKAIRRLGPSWMYKAIRHEGIYEGGAVFNTDINTADEAAYLKALDDLKAIFDANGFKDLKLNLWRIVAGRKDSTHLVILSLPSQMRVTELIDALTDKGLLKEWNVAAGKIRTTVENGTYHEITK